MIRFLSISNDEGNHRLDGFYRELTDLLEEHNVTIYAGAFNSIHAINKDGAFGVIDGWVDPPEEICHIEAQISNLRDRQATIMRTHLNQKEPQ